MTNTSPREPAKRVKAIWAPSGDQAGSESFPGLFVRFVGALPSGFMT
jgi:hypothetical protein